MSRSCHLVASAVAVLVVGACGRSKAPQRDVSVGDAGMLLEHVRALGCVMQPHPTEYFSDVSFECRRTIRRTPCCSVHLMVDARTDGTGSRRVTISDAGVSILGCDDEEAISYGVSLLAPLLTEDERDTLNGFVRSPRIPPDRLEAEEIQFEQTRMIDALHVTAGFQGGVTAAAMPHRHLRLDRYSPTGVRETRLPPLLRHWLLDSQVCPAGT